MKVISYDEYDRVMDEFDRMHAPVYLPTTDDIEYMENNNPDDWVMFANYVYDRCDKPKNKAEKYRKTKLLEFINANLKFKD